MEETQMPSAGVPQEPTPDANPNPPVSSPEQTPAPTPKKGGGLIKILVGVFAIAILGFGGWYAYDSGLFGGDSEDTPPSLKIAGAGFQGKSVETTFGFQQYDPADITAFDDSGMSLKTSTKSINFFNVKRATDFAEIEASVKPTEDLKLLIVHFDKNEPWPWDPAEQTYDGCFVTYPVGPYLNTCEVLPNDLADKKLNPGEVAILITNIDYEYDSNLLADSKTLGGPLNIPEGKGWSLHPITQNMEIPSNVTSAWVQIAQNDFEKATDPENIDINREYKMAWFKLGDALSVGDSTIPTPSVCGDGNVDSGEACDDGTNNSDTIANACRTTCVVADCGDGVVDAGEDCDGGADCEADCTLTPAAPVCGDGNVDSGEECDGTADCESDCTLTPVVTEVCGNNTIEGTEVCDGTDLDGKNCINYVDGGSAFSEGTLGCAADCSAYDISACATGSSSGGTEETAPTTTFRDDSVNTNIGINLGNITSRVPANTTGTIAPTKTGNAYVEHVQYIDNIEKEFPGITLASNISGQLYTTKVDTTPNGIPVTAIEVKAGGTTGNIKLNLARFYSYGYTPDSTKAQLEYCNGAGDWEFYRIQEKEDDPLATEEQIVFSLEENMIAERGYYTFKDTSDFNYDPIVATINAGESAVFYLLMEDMSACHDASNGTGTSSSQTDITKLIFIEGDLDEKIYLKTDIIHHDLDRKIIWIDPASTGGSAVSGHSFFN